MGDYDRKFNFCKLFRLIWLEVIYSNSVNGFSNEIAKDSITALEYVKIGAECTQVKLKGFVDNHETKFEIQPEDNLLSPGQLQRIQTDCKEFSSNQDIETAIKF